MAVVAPTTNLISDRTSNLILNSSATFWFVVTAVGQWIFVFYIVGLYLVSALQGDLNAWNKVLPHGYESGNGVGNSFLGAHLFLAAIISFCGPLQLIPKLRARMPRLHRWNGRIYMAIAFVMSISGLYLMSSGRSLVGDFSQYLAISINAVLILFFGVMSLRYALMRNFLVHRRWALRLFLAVSGVWLFRVGLMFWLLVNGGPVGFDPKSFSGPFPTFLAFGVYVFPAVFLETYLQAKDHAGSLGRVLTAAGIFTLTIVMGVGIFGATAGMWLPRL